MFSSLVTSKKGSYGSMNQGWSPLGLNNIEKEVRSVHTCKRPKVEESREYVKNIEKRLHHDLREHINIHERGVNPFATVNRSNNTIDSNSTSTGIYGVGARGPTAINTNYIIPATAPVDLLPLSRKKFELTSVSAGEYNDKQKTDAVHDTPMDGKILADELISASVISFKYNISEAPRMKTTLNTGINDCPLHMEVHAPVRYGDILQHNSDLVDKSTVKKQILKIDDGASGIQPRFRDNELFKVVGDQQNNTKDEFIVSRTGVKNELFQYAIPISKTITGNKEETTTEAFSTKKSQTSQDSHFSKLLPTMKPGMNQTSVTSNIFNQIKKDEPFTRKPDTLLSKRLNVSASNSAIPLTSESYKQPTNIPLKQTLDVSGYSTAMVVNQFA